MLLIDLKAIVFNFNNRELPGTEVKSTKKS